MADAGRSAEIQMVVLAAVKAELPFDWLQDAGARVHSIQAVKSGALKGTSHPEGGAGIVFITTGVGPGAAHEAGCWVRDNLRPAHVINIGGGGCLDQSAAIGSWVMPAEAVAAESPGFSLDGRLPFPWPVELALGKGGRILSTRHPIEQESRSSCQKAAYVDMECHALAQVFHGTPVSFHAVKFVSDRADSDTSRSYQSCLSRMREELKKILSFIRVPPSPDISVIIPVYNRSEWIGACVDSVLEQTLTPAEVIVVDDGSTDATAEVLERLVGRVHVVRLEKQCGVSVARNVGVARSTGSWLCFLDSDDLWRADKLAGQWTYLQRYPFYEILQTDEVWIRRGVRVNPCKHHLKSEGWIWQHCLERCMITPSAVMMTREIFDRFGGFDESLPACEDYDLWLKISRCKPVGLDRAQTVVKHGGHEDQLSAAHPAMDRFRVRSLHAAWVAERDEGFREVLETELGRRLKILLAGSRKRGLVDETGEYLELMNELGMTVPGSDS